jgi:hypothetical protein
LISVDALPAARKFLPSTRNECENASTMVFHRT